MQLRCRKEHEYYKNSTVLPTDRSMVSNSGVTGPCIACILLNIRRESKSRSPNLPHNLGQILADFQNPFRLSLTYSLGNLQYGNHVVLNCNISLLSTARYPHRHRSEFFRSIRETRPPNFTQNLRLRHGTRRWQRRASRRSGRARRRRAVLSRRRSIRNELAPI